MNGEGSNTWMVLFLSQPIDSKLSLLARQHTTNGTSVALCVHGDHPTHTHTAHTSLFPRFCYLKHQGINTRIQAKVQVSSHPFCDDEKVRVHFMEETLDFSLNITLAITWLVVYF